MHNTCTNPGTAPFEMRDRQPGENENPGEFAAAAEMPETEETDPEDDQLLCRNCRAVITAESGRISVDGAHCHTFANPHGIVFEIGCFQSAPGCGVAGPPSGEFSWFPPRLWQVAVCGSCLTHMGWRFSSAQGGGFFGLILDRLAKPGS